MKKKAFTLIELLAVIVILAVIALIVIPLILGIINNAKYKKYKVEEGNIKEAAKLYYASKNIEEKDQEEVSLKTLVDTKFMDPVVDSMTGKECEGKAIKLKDGKLKGCLKCSNYVTKGCGYTPDEDDEEGNPEPEIVDNNPGIICGDKLEEDYNNVTECHIRSVEDLVEFTKMVKSKYDFSGKDVYLDKNLDIKDFKKGNSYVDPDALASFDINGDGEITSLKDEMTTDGGFYPIGILYEVAFSGRFEGNAKTIKNLMINRPNTDNVGLFGYVRRGTVLGLNLIDVNVTGKNYVGAIAGYNYGNVYEIKVSGNITGNNYVSGVAAGYGNIYSAIVNANVTGNEYIYGVGNDSYGIMESGTVKGNKNVYAGNGATYSTATYYGAVLVNKKVILEDSSGPIEINETIYEDSTYGDLNLYDTPLSKRSIDTYLSGDENGSGYYFDYNSKGELVIKSTKKYPIDITLKTLKPEKDNNGGTQDNPYLIYTYEDMKKVAAIPGEANYYRLMNDIDFKDKKYYMIGTKSHPFKGYFDGNGYTLKNIILEGYSNVGIFGYINGSASKVSGLNVDGLTVLGQSDYIGGLVGYLDRDNRIIGVNLNNVNVKGNNYVGGIVGHNYIAYVREATINGNVTGNNYVYGAIGGSTGTNINILANVNVTGNENVYGLGQSAEGLVEGGNITGNRNVNGASSCPSTCGSCQCWGDTYINTDVVINAPDGQWDYGAIRIPSNTYNNLREYSLLKHKWSSESHILILETPYSGDINDSGYYFDYNDSGTDIIVVKTNSKTPINPNIDPNNPDNTTSPEIVHQVIKDNTKPLPECELTRFNVYGKGFTASYSCTDEEEIIERKHIYWIKPDVDDYDSLIMWGSITPAQLVTVNSVWTESSAASQKIDPPYPNNCYYFYYGAKNKVGNEVIYRTGYCLSY